MKSKVYYYNSLEKNCSIDLSLQLSSIISEYNYSEVIILCIGSDRSTGDSLGPLIGYKLEKLPEFSCRVFGTLNKPVHAINLYESIEYIKSSYPDSLIVAIDAAVGSREHIGYITLSSCPLKPGLGVLKDLPAIGHICITGIVNFQNVLDNMLLQSTRLDTVMQLADTITDALINAFIYLPVCC